MGDELEFIPHELLLKFHDTSRPIPGGGSASNVFNVDLDTSDGKNYMAGAFSRSIAIWAFAGVFGVLIFLSLIGSIFCNRRCRKKPYGGKSGIRKWIGPRCVYLLMVLGMTLSSIVALAHGPKYVTGITDGLKGIQSLGNSFVHSHEVATDVVLPNYNALLAKLDDAKDIAVDSHLYTNLLNLENEALDVFDNALPLRDSLEELAHIWNRDFLNADIESYEPKINWDEAKGGLSKGLYAVGAISILWLVFHSLGLFANKCSAIYFRSTVLITLVMAVLTMTMCAFTLAVAFIGSDFCVDPPASVSNVLGLIDTTPVVRETITYYASCPNDDPSQGLEVDLYDIRNRVIAHRDSINNARDEATSLGETDVVELLDTAFFSAQDAIEGLSDMSDHLDCNDVGETMVPTLDGLCNKAIVGDIHATMALGAAGIFFIPLLFGAVSLCFRHPGDSLTSPLGEAGETVVKNPQQEIPQAWTPHSTPISAAPVRHGASNMV